MDGQLWWIFDGLTILIAVYLIFSNIKRGLTKVFVLNIGYIFAIFLSGLVAVGAAPQLYEYAVQEDNVDKLTEVVESVNLPKVFAAAADEKSLGFHCDPAKIQEYLKTGEADQFADRMYHYLSKNYGQSIGDFTAFEKSLRDAYVKAYGDAMNEKLPQYIRVNFEKQMAEDPNLMTELLAVTYGPKSYAKKTAQAFEERFANELNTEILRMFIYTACFAVIMIISAVIAAAMKNTLFFNVTRASERTYGALLGLAETTALLILFTVLVRMIVLLGGGETLFFNDPTVERSKVFSLLYDHLSFLI